MNPYHLPLLTLLALLLLAPSAAASHVGVNQVLPVDPVGTNTWQTDWPRLYIEVFNTDGNATPETSFQSVLIRMYDADKSTGPANLVYTYQLDLQNLTSLNDFNIQWSTVFRPTNWPWSLTGATLEVEAIAPGGSHKETDDLLYTSDRTATLLNHQTVQATWGNAELEIHGDPTITTGDEAGFTITRSRPELFVVQVYAWDSHNNTYAPLGPYHEWLPEASNFLTLYHTPTRTTTTADEGTYRLVITHPDTGYVTDREYRITPAGAAPEHPWFDFHWTTTQQDTATQELLAAYHADLGDALAGGISFAALWAPILVSAIMIGVIIRTIP